MAKEKMKQARSEAFQERPRRLLKAWLATDLIRRMDQAILASRGGYSDRTEFLSEAIRDRLEADAQEPSPFDIRPLARPPASARGEEALSEPATSIGGDLAAPISNFGDWSSATVPTLPGERTGGTTFGLHNRDFPTLFAADQIGRMTSNAGRGLPLAEMTEAVVETAWEVGAALKEADLDRPRGASTAAGFPTNRRKPDAVASRFREHFVGTVDSNGARGPLFLFGVCGADGENVALSEAGLSLLRSLMAAGVGSGPPFGEDAWEAFASHLQANAFEELEMWRRVLAIIATEPDRESLIRSCGWWSGSAADTNSMGYTARGREWGLVEVALKDGAYQLTERGVAEVRRER